MSGKGYSAHKELVSDAGSYIRMGLCALLIGLAAQAALFCWLAVRLYDRTLSYPRRDGRVFTLPFAAYRKIHYPQFVIMGRENKLEVPPEVAPFFRHEGFTAPAVPQSTYKAVMSKYFGPEIADYEQALRFSFRWSFGCYALSVLYFAWSCKRSRKMQDTRHLRGAYKVPLARLKAELDKHARREAGRPHLRLCGLTIPHDLETKHILVMGTTGTGKSVLINQVIAQILARMDKHRTNEKTIIYDVKGEFLSKHYDAGRDILFYPPDKRSVRWSFFNEIRTDNDFDTLAHIIFRPPQETNTDPYWHDAPREVFVAGLRYLHHQGCRQNADIWNFFAQDKADIVTQLKTLPIHERAGLKHIDSAGVTGPAANVLSGLTTAISWFYDLRESDGPFSLRDYIASTTGKNLYLLNIMEYAEKYRPLMTFVFDVLINATLSLPDTNHREQRRIWYVIDEVGSLNQIKSLFNLLTVARSKGGCLLVANQDLGRIETIYGKANVQTFFNNFNTGFILRIKDPKTADFLSQSIGEREVIKRMDSRQMSPGDFGNRKTVSDQDKVERVMLPSEFQQIADFKAVVNLGGYGITTAEVPREFIQERAAHFECRYKPLDP